MYSTTKRLSMIDLAGGWFPMCLQIPCLYAQAGESLTKI